MVSVNVSARQFRQDNLVRTVAEVLEETGLEARYLEIELTESMVMHDAAQLVAMLERAQAPGRADLRRRLRHRLFQPELPQALPGRSPRRSIARSSSTSPRTSDDATIVRAIITLGHNLGLKVVAEGVEQPAQVDFLRLESLRRSAGVHLLPPDRRRRSWPRNFRGAEKKRPRFREAFEEQAGKVTPLPAGDRVGSRKKRQEGGFFQSTRTNPRSCRVSSTSMFTADGIFGRPGIVMTSPQIITMNSAPAARRTSRTLTTWPLGAPSSFGSVENEYCVFATQTG